MSNVLGELKKWFKVRRREITILALIFITSTLSFAAGYLMAKDSSRAPIVIEKLAS